MSNGFDIGDLKYEYKDISPGDVVTVRLSDVVCIKSCIVLSKSFMIGKVLYTVAIPTGEKSDIDDCGCLVNSLVFINKQMYVRLENLDSTFVLGD